MGSLPLTPAWFTQTTISRSAKAAWRACVFLLLASLSNTEHFVPLVILESPWSRVIKRVRMHLSRPQRGVRSCRSQLCSLCTNNHLVAILLHWWSVECPQPCRYWILETQGIRKKRYLESDVQSYPAQGVSVCFICLYCPFPVELQKHLDQSSGGLQCPGERVHSEHLVFAFKIMFYGPRNGAPNTVLLCLLRKPDSDFWFVKFTLARKVLLLILVGHLGFRF